MRPPRAASTRQRPGSKRTPHLHSAPVPETGCVWIVDAFGCDPERLRSERELEALVRAAVEELDLHPMRETVWQHFPAPGGLTGFLVLSESHLSIHTFPERGYAALDLYCCRRRPEWDWSARLAEFLGATRVELRALERGVDPRTLERGVERASAPAAPGARGR